MNTVYIALAVLLIAVIMTMTGKGGGNYYVVAMVIAGYSMHEAATLGQFILMITATVGMLVFHKSKLVDWKLALVIDPPTDIMAFVGGYFSDKLDGTYLKLIFSVLLVVAGLLMLRKSSYRTKEHPKGFGYWHRSYGGYSYSVNLWLAIPLTAVVGLVSGAIGVSGGSFKIPLMVLLCGVPMPIAVGTSSAMVAATALMGFLGHSASGHFDPTLAIPLGIAAVAGGFLGGKIAVRTKVKNLKLAFAVTTFAAAVFMAVNALL